MVARTLSNPMKRESIWSVYGRKRVRQRAGVRRRSVARRSENDETEFCPGKCAILRSHSHQRWRRRQGQRRACRRDDAYGRAGRRRHSPRLEPAAAAAAAAHGRTAVAVVGFGRRRDFPGGRRGRQRVAVGVGVAVEV